MKISVLIGAWFIGSCGSLLQAGSVFVIGGGSETDGILTLNSTAIHVEGSLPSDVNLPDVLEADFGETPFPLRYFSTTNGATQLPADLKGQDIGHPTLPGALSYADGTVTLTGSGVDRQRKESEDQNYVFGEPWTGDGQVTARLKELDGPSIQAGPMLRESLDPLSIYFSMGVAADGGGLFRYRYVPATHPGWSDFGSDVPPNWMRLTRSGFSLDLATSRDGQKWQIINQLNLKASAISWLGFFLDTLSDQTTGKAILDQFTLTPGAPASETVPPGVLLRSGSFLAGSFHTTDPKSGSLDRNGKAVALTTDQIAAVVLHPVTRRQIDAVAAQAGLIMKNGDFLAGDIQSMDGGSTTVKSPLVGTVSYPGEAVRAAVFQPVQSQPSDYEVRLKDGSIVRASSFNAGGGQVAISEISGASVDGSVAEIAQVRAGLSRVQPLIDLPWKATAPPVAKTPPVATTSLAAPMPPVTNAAPAVATAPPTAPMPPVTNAAPAIATAPPAAPMPPVTNAAPAVAVAPAIPADTNSGVQCWGGPNQEQILAVPAGTSLEFPLSGKFSALALRVAVSPDAPPNAKVMVRFLVGGRELASTPAFKAGDPPRFVEATFLSTKTVTIMADSNIAGTKTLLIDPVAIRQQ